MSETNSGSYNLGTNLENLYCGISVATSNYDPVQKEQEDTDQQNEHEKIFEFDKNARETNQSEFNFKKGFDSHTQDDYNRSVTILNHIKGSGNMSFVGVIYCAGKFIGFADKRSSIQTVNGFQPDPDHKEVKKLFWNKSFIASFSGINSICILKDGIGKKVCFQDWINEEMKTESSPTDLFSKMAAYLKNNAVGSFGDICMNAGMYQDDKPVLIQAIFSSKSFSYKAEFPDGFLPYYSGQTDIVNYFNRDRTKMMTVKADILESELKKAHKQIEKEGEYCTVGNDWDIHIFEKETDLVNAEK